MELESKQKKQLLTALGVYAIVFLVLLLISNLTSVVGWLYSLLHLFRPLLIGLVIAYLCNPFFRFFERKLFAKIKPMSLRRGISLIFTYLVVLLIIGILLMLIVPQLIQSIADFIADADANIDRSVSEINHLIGMLNGRLPETETGEARIPLLEAEQLKKNISEFFQSINLDSKTLLQYINPEMIFSALDMAQDVFFTITDIIFGLFISLYLLHTKEKRYAQIIRLRKVLFSDETNLRISKICKTADESFGGFIKGKMLDSAMVGLLVYVAISILGVPYAILISVIIGITDFVPVIGPFIGVIPSAIIILLTDPGKVIPFLLCILVVQQIDGNIVAPKILGENTGVSSLCVMIAITTMGSLWGLVGMVIGVPLFATVLELTGDYLDQRLERKGLSTSTAGYYAHSGVPMEKENETLIQRLQKKRILRLQQGNTGGEGNLTALERLQLDTYALGRKYGVFSKKNDAIPDGFVEEESELTAAIQEQLEQMEVQEEQENLVASSDTMKKSLQNETAESAEEQTAELESQENV
ncbi:MAG: AI-2E family transporter [Clostridia bacterium]|nr:AI-2E family transporter [Clostridia bacterium]